MIYDENSRLAGRIGLGLSSCLWLLSTWRLVFHLFTSKRENATEEEEDTARRRLSPPTPSKWFTRRRTFHGLLWLSQSIEIIAYLDISGIVPLSNDRIFAEKLGYILLDVTGRSVLELLSFTTITGLWLKTAIQSGPARNLDRSQDMRFHLFPALFLIITLMLVIASASLSIVVFSVFRTDSLETIQNSQLGRAQFLLEAFAWGLHSMVVLECLLLTWKRIIALVDSSPERMKLLCKAVLPMVITALAYALRCAWLVSIFCHFTKIERGTWSYWICFEWCPTWLAVSMLLYSARKRDQVEENDLQQPLLRPRPPAEAFLAFSRHRNLENGEEVNDSFCLNSPIMQVNISSDEEAVADTETLSTDSFRDATTPEPG